MGEKLLIVDDEPQFLVSCQRMLKQLDLQVFTAGCGTEALEIISTERPGLVLTDLRMPELDGMELTKKALEVDKNILVLIMTGFGTVELAVQSIKQGAFDFILKPFSADQLRVAVTRALSQRRLMSQNKFLQSQLTENHSFRQITGKSSAMLKVFELAGKVAATDANILILGESGTGKEVLARAIHFNGARADKPFVPIDCASLPENLLESELFGHEKGAFTGAISSKTGLLESANGGTVFLDEVGELPLNLQVKLLRVLQERSFRRVGSNKEIAVDIRVLAATNRDLWALVQDKSFRKDLFFRLNVISIELPPLRERIGDITLLARTFVGELGSGKEITGITPEAEKALEQYSWPGNIRELRNTIERAVALVEEKLIRLEDLPPHILGAGAGPGVIRQEEVHYAGLNFNEAKDRVITDFERAYLSELLGRCDYHMTKAALEAGINRKTLYRLLIKHDIDHF